MSNKKYFIIEYIAEIIEADKTRKGNPIAKQRIQDQTSKLIKKTPKLKTKTY